MFPYFVKNLFKRDSENIKKHPSFKILSSKANAYIDSCIYKALKEKIYTMNSAN